MRTKLNKLADTRRRYALKPFIQFHRNFWFCPIRHGTPFEIFHRPNVIRMYVTHYTTGFVLVKLIVRKQLMPIVYERSTNR